MKECGPERDHISGTQQSCKCRFVDKEGFSTTVLGQLILMSKKINFNSQLAVYTNMNAKFLIDLTRNIKYQMTRRKHSRKTDCGLCKGFFDTTPKTQLRKKERKKDHLDFLKIKNFYPLKDTLKRTKN